MDLVNFVFELLKKYGIWAGAIAFISIVVSVIKARLNALKIKSEAISIKEKEEELGTKLDDILGQARLLMGASSAEPRPCIFQLASTSQFEEAEKKINQAMRIAPNYSRCYYELGTLNLRKANLSLAIKSFNWAIKLDSKNYYYYFSLANAYKLKSINLFDQFGLEQLRKKGNFWSKVSIVYYHFRSLLLFNRVVKKIPEFYSARVQLANQLKMISPRRAIQEYESAIRIEPENKLAYKLLASFLVSRNEIERAKPIAHLAYQLDAKDVQTLNLLSEIHALENNPEKLQFYLGERSKVPAVSAKSETFYEKLRANSIFVDGEMKNVRDHHLYQKIKSPRKMTDDAFKCHLSGDSEKSAQLLTYLASSDPEEPIYPLMLCLIALDTRAIEKALGYLERAEMLKAHDEDVQIAKIIIFYNQHKYDQVIELSKWYLDTIEDNGYVRYLLCWSLLHSNQILEAANEISVFQAKHTNSYYDLVRLSSLFDEIKEPDMAKQMVQQAIRRQPERPEAFIRLCQHSIKINDYSGLAQHSQAALNRRAEKDLCDYYNALVLIENGNFDEAINILKECIFEAPNKPVYYYQLGSVYSSKNEKEKARGTFTQSLEIDPVYYDSLFSLGELSLDALDYSGALKYFSQALSAAPCDLDASFYVALCYEKLGEIDKAIEQYEQTIRLGDKDPTSFNNLGILYEKNNDKEKALSYYQQALKLSPKYAEAKFNVGAVYFSNKDYLKSIEYFESACKLAPKNKQNLEALAESYLETQHYEKCLDVGEALISLDPDNYSGHEYVAKSRRALEQYDEAILAFKRAAERSQSRKPEYLNEIGNIYLLQENLDLAESEYFKIVKSFPNDPVAYLNVGVVCHRRGDTNAAFDWCNKSTDIDKTYYLAYFNRAHIYNAQGNKLLALKELEKARQYAPDNTEILNFIGCLQGDLKQYDSAIKSWERCIEVSPHYAFPHRNIGNLLKELKRFEEAIPPLMVAIELDDNYLDAYQDLYEIYSSLKLKKEAANVKIRIEKISEKTIEKQQS